MILYAATVFLSSFLLFLVQPIVAKQILPWFGGSAAVWTTCLVFFQCVLLLGYGYADWTTRRLAPRAQALVHACLLAASLALLPVVADPAWKPLGAEDPALRILGLLAVTVGLPYFLLSTTGPLVQAWFARTFPGRTPYRLFALSNLSSLLGLLAYPFAVEPRTTTAGQSYGWSAAYVVFALACLGSVRQAARVGPAAQAPDALPEGRPPRPSERAVWLALGGLGSFLLLAITNHLCLNIASIPFLWVVPLSLYLLSFIVCFDGRGWYRPALVLPLTAAVLVAMGVFLASPTLGLALKLAIPLYLAGLFVCCLFCHGELAARKPAPRHLTGFYLMVSSGGALGALAVGVAAPYALPGYFELGFGLLAVALALFARLRRRSRPLALAGLAVCVAVAVCWGAQVHRYASARRVMTRNFYGTLRTSDTLTPGGEPVRQFVHGAIKHGEQFLRPGRRREATGYYSARSGIGLALRALGHPARVGVVGLGAGTLTVYAGPGDYYRLYEINPLVVDVARSEFTFLRDLPARSDVVLGDARLALEREPPQGFDLLVLDAFSGDAIPAHLVTREAFRIYLRHLRPGGALAVHATNRYLDIVPVVASLARASGMEVLRVRDDEPPDEPNGYCATDWVLVGASSPLFSDPNLRSAAAPVPPAALRRLWTDDFNDLFEILK